MTTKRWKITIEYRGSDYYGWQKQPDMPTIQGAIEEALYKFCQQKISIHAAGRTDAGVHARGQVAHFDLDYGARTLTGTDLAKAINAHLRPQPITIIKAEEVAPDFESRFGAKNKLYQYRIINRPGFLALEQGMAWQVRKPLDVQAMHDAAQVLIGRHDFSTFRDAQCQANSAMRTLDKIRAISRPYDEGGGTEILIEVEAMSFLHHMVRNIVGTLSLIGDKKWSADDLRLALEAKDRTKGGPTAPADGLYLIKIDYL